MLARLGVYRLASMAAGPRPEAYYYVPVPNNAVFPAATLFERPPVRAQLCRWSAPMQSPNVQVQAGPARPTANVSNPHFPPHAAGSQPWAPSPQHAARDFQPSITDGSYLSSVEPLLYRAGTPPPGYGHASEVQQQEAERRRLESNRTPPGLEQLLIRENRRLGQLDRDRSSRSRSR